MKYRIVQFAPNKFKIQQKGWLFWGDITGGGMGSGSLTYETHDAARAIVDGMIATDSFVPRIVEVIEV